MEQNGNEEEKLHEWMRMYWIEGMGREEKRREEQRRDQNRSQNRTGGIRPDQWIVQKRREHDRTGGMRSDQWFVEKRTGQEG